MMTFDEFFLKKKIDLKSLANAKPALFHEFKIHYAQMGEKSFDHTKKYWFNPLRKDFRLSEEDELKLKEALLPIKTEVIEVPSLIKVSEFESSPVQGFKPRFRAAPVHVKEEEKVEETPSLEEKPKEEIAKPIGFKPRFKAATATLKQEEKIEETPPLEEKPKEEVAKPIGFKPRFKAVSTPVKQEEKVEETPSLKEHSKEEVAKPIGFKPRFKAGITPIKKSED